MPRRERPSGRPTLSARLRELTVQAGLGPIGPAGADRVLCRIRRGRVRPHGRGVAVRCTSAWSSRSAPPTDRSAFFAVGSEGAARPPATFGPRSSTISPPRSVRGCLFPRRSRPWASGVPRQLREPFRRFGADYRATGRFEECLDTLKSTLADPTADRVIESLRLARAVGGSDLGRLLRTLSGFLRDDARTRAELESRQSWTVNAARLAVAAPWIVLGDARRCARQRSQAYNATGGLIVLGRAAPASAPWPTG